MKRGIFILAICLFLLLKEATTVFGADIRAEIDRCLKGYFNAIQNEDVISLARLMNTKDVNLLRLYSVAFKSADQRLLAYNLKKILTDNKNKRAMAFVSSSWEIKKNDGSDKYQEDKEQVFLLEKKNQDIKILKIIRKENFDLYIKNYFFKKKSNIDIFHNWPN